LKNKIAELFDGYLKAYDNGFRSYNELFRIVGTGRSFFVEKT
jgi:hypothetical protein